VCGVIVQAGSKKAALVIPRRPVKGSADSHLLLPFLPQTVTQIAGRTRLEAAGDPVQRHRRLGAQPFGDLTIDYDPAGNVRLRLAVGAAVEDIMLFAQAPCSAGRMKHRRVNYLGLLGPATEGQRDITAAVVARYGEPRPGQKIFAVTGQHKNGWKALST
jgi:hypothetical protein